MESLLGGPIKWVREKVGQMEPQPRRSEFVGRGENKDPLGFKDKTGEAVEANTEKLNMTQEGGGGGAD